MIKKKKYFPFLINVLITSIIFIPINYFLYNLLNPNIGKTTFFILTIIVVFVSAGFARIKNPFYIKMGKSGKGKSFKNAEQMKEYYKENS